MTKMDIYWRSNPEWYDYADDDEGNPYLTDKAPEEAKISFANFLKQKEENENRLDYKH